MIGLVMKYNFRLKKQLVEGLVGAVIAAGVSSLLEPVINWPLVAAVAVGIFIGAGFRCFTD